MASRRTCALVLITGAVVFAPLGLRAQEVLPAPQSTPKVKRPSTPRAESEPTALPINLPTALRLANAQPLDIALAAQRVEAAAAALERANVLWLPTIYLGVDYARHDGQIQGVEGNV